RASSTSAASERFQPGWILSLRGDAVEILHPGDEEPAVRDGGRGMVRVSQVVHGEHLQLGTRLDHVALPAAREVDAAVAVGDRTRPRGSELVETLLVGLLAVGRRPDADDASGDEAHDMAAHDDRGSDGFSET